MYVLGSQKVVGYFPRTMPDSGLPDSDYGLKVPIPASIGNSSNESIHQFNDEGGCEGHCDDFYGQSRDPSTGNSPNNNDPNAQFERTLRAEMRRNDNFQYLFYTPDYDGMGAVYAEIADLPPASTAARCCSMSTRPRPSRAAPSRWKSWAKWSPSRRAS